LLLAARVGAAQDEDPVGVLRVGGPGLLPVEQEVVTLVFGAELERREIAAGVRLRVALAPDLLAREDLRQEALLLPLRAELHDQRRHHREAKR
jgi:hypothetical protein